MHSFNINPETVVWGSLIISILLCLPGHPPSYISQPQMSCYLTSLLLNCPVLPHLMSSLPPEKPCTPLGASNIGSKETRFFIFCCCLGSTSRPLAVTKDRKKGHCSAVECTFCCCCLMTCACVMENTLHPTLHLSPCFFLSQQAISQAHKTTQDPGSTGPLLSQGLQICSWDKKC